MVSEVDKGDAKMKKEYDTFVENLSHLAEGKEIDLTIRDLNPGRHKYESHYVKAILSSFPDQLTGSDILWIRFPLGFLHSKPWGIKIINVLGEYQP